MRLRCFGAARWLPFAFAATVLWTALLQAQTSGLPAPMSGDCTTTQAAVVTCSKTAGTSFAASATTDATNASNITRGTLPVAQLPTALAPADVVAQVRSALGSDGSLLAAWLHAESAAPFRDYSGNGNDGTAGAVAPVWTRVGLQYAMGRGPGANGSSTAEGGSTASTWTVPASVYASAQTYVARLCFRGGDANGNGSYHGFLALSSDATNGLVLGLSGRGYSSTRPQYTTYRPTIGTGSTPSATATDTIIPGCPVVAFVLGTSASSPDAIYVNGQAVSLPNVSFSAGARGVGTFSFGGGARGMYMGMEGGVLAINRAITQAEAASLSNILRSYSASNGLTETASALSAYDEIIAGADNSITVGAGYTPVYPSISATELGTMITPVGSNVLWSSADAAVQGNTLSSSAQRMLQQFPYNPAAKRVTYLLHDCTNDWMQYDQGGDTNGTTAAYQVCAQRTLQLARDLHGLGPNVRTVVLSELQNQSLGTNQVPAVNAYFRQNCPTSGADVCLLDTDPVFYAGNAANSTTYFVDGVHPTKAGQHYKAAIEAMGYNLAWNSSTEQSPTVVSAAYVMKAQDRVVRVTGSVQTTLPSCYSLSGRYVLRNAPNVASTVKGVAGQTVNGVDISGTAYSLQAGSSLSLTIVPNSTPGAGCSWEATTQLAAVMPVDTSLIYSWAMNETGGTTSAETVSGNTLTYANAPTWTTDATLGNVPSFSGSSSGGVTANNANANFANTQPFSISAYLKASSLPSSSATYDVVSTLDTTSKARGYALYVRGNGALYAQFISDVGASNYTLCSTNTGLISPGTLYKVSVVFTSASNIAFNVNGSTVSSSCSGTLSGTLANTMNLLYVGTESGGGGGSPFPGVIARVRIFNRALGASE